MALVSPRLAREVILAALRHLPGKPARLLMVHSSLSSCGYIKGGAVTVISALQEWKEAGTLAMPAHTYCYPKPDGTCPVYIVDQTPSVVGAITDCFWRMPGVQRSLHPTHSLSCEGPEASRLISGHENCRTPCGKGTPYEHLVEADASVLMFGASLDSYTLFHTAEDAANVPYLYEPKPYLLKICRRDGATQDFPMLRQDMTVTRRFADMASWLEERKLLVRQPVGKGELLWLPSALAIHHALTDALRREPWLLVAKAERPSTSQINFD